jgi:glycosyltransferase involved in cell wall biosynthesis
LDKEIIIVDDGSTDGTQQLLQQEAREENTKVIFHESNKGKGAAVRTGLAHATGNVMVIQDGDLEYDPQDFLKMIQLIAEGKTKVVFGSRFLGICKNMNVLNRIANMWLTFVTNLMFNTYITDGCTAYKMFTSDVLHNICLSSDGFEFCQEACAEFSKRGYRILEVPITYHARSREQGKKANWWQLIISTLALIKYRLQK